MKPYFYDLNVKHCKPFLLTAVLLLFTLHTLLAQQYLSLGFHLTAPIYLENPKNTHVVARPQPGFGGSVTYKKVWNGPRRDQWHLETGLSLQGLRYHLTNYTGDSL